MTLFKRLKRRKPTEEAPQTVLFLRSEHAPCTHWISVALPSRTRGDALDSRAHPARR